MQENMRPACRVCKRPEYFEQHRSCKNCLLNQRERPSISIAKVMGHKLPPLTASKDKTGQKVRIRDKRMKPF